VRIVRSSHAIDLSTPYATHGARNNKYFIDTTGVSDYDRTKKGGRDGEAEK